MIKKLILFIWILILPACEVQLFQGLPENEANKIIKELETSGIEAKKTITDKRKGLFGVEVSQNDISHAISILNSKDLPRPKRKGLSIVLKSSSIIPSPSENRIKYYIGLADELSDTLEKLSGVQFAKVHFALPSINQMLNFDKKDSSPKKASVILKVDEKKFQLKAQEIQILIAGSLPNIESDSVAVIIQHVQQNKIEFKQHFAYIGPFKVAPSSKYPILITFLFLFLIIIITTTLFFLSKKKKNSVIIPEDEKD
jgi:type III secretion protein J